MVEKSSVIMIEDHTQTREQIVHLLKGSEQFQVLKALISIDSDRLLSDCLEAVADLLILDIHIPNGEGMELYDGFDVVKKFKTVSPKTTSPLSGVS